MVNSDYLLLLHLVNGLGPVRLKNLLDAFDNNPKRIWETNTKDIKALKETHGVTIPENVLVSLENARKALVLSQVLEDLDKDNIKFVTLFDENYPRLLKEIYDPPIILYYKGEFQKRDEKAIGVVGTRKITGYGKLVTEKFTRYLVGAGFTIISGLARGVDTIAHQTAVEGGCRTIAVLGGGLKKIYPPENIRLAEKIWRGQGAVVSEFPPDFESLPGNFPARNRIISGLSKAILVTEAASDSGSLITARVALEQNRDVYAVPGPVTSDLSRGPADLIKEGARLVFEAQDILDDLGVTRIENDELRIKNYDGLSDQEVQVLGCLENENKHIDEIVRELNLNAALASGTLLKMEIQGLVRNLGGGVYCRI